MKAKANKIIKLIEKTRTNSDNSITKIQGLLQDLHNRMDEKYWEKKEDWRQSNKGAEYEQKMEEVQGFISQLDSILETFDSDLDAIAFYLEQ